MNRERVLKAILASGIIFLITDVTVLATSKRTESIVSKGVMNVATPTGPVCIDSDDIKQNAEAIDAIKGQLSDLHFKYEDNYYWAKKGENEPWEKIGAVGNAAPWMVLKNVGTNNTTFSSQAGVDINGSMENYAGKTSVVASTNNHSERSITNIENDKYLSLNIPETGYYEKDSSSIAYNMSNFGNATTSNVVEGNFFTSEVGINMEGIIKQNPRGTVNTSAGALQSSEKKINDNNPILINNNSSSDLCLGLNQTLTIPKGYYSGDIVIKNGVPNRGALNWTPAESTVYNVPSGYYTGGKIDTSTCYWNGYNRGSIEGRNQAIANAKVTGMSISGIWNPNNNSTYISGLSVGTYYWLRLHTWKVASNTISLSGCENYGYWYMSDETDGKGNADHCYIVKATSPTISLNKQIQNIWIRSINFNVN